MRILFVPPLPFPMEIGGFQSQVRHIYEELKKIGIDVSWYDLINTDISKYDIVHFHSSTSSFADIAKKAKDLNKKIVLTPMIGSPYTTNTSYFLKLKASRFPGLFYPLKRINYCFSVADHFITLTSFEKKRLDSIFNVSNKKMTVIPNGIDDEFFNKNDLQLDFPCTKFILVVGRVEANKNQLPLIKIANELNLNLIIVGEPGLGQLVYDKECRRVAGDTVYFWGKELNVANMRMLYKNAILTVIPSVTEMLPLVIFESLSQKTPVLCTDHCGLYPKQYPGLYYTSPTEISLRKNIKRVFDILPISNIGNEGIYSWKDIALKHIDVYRKVLAQPKTNDNFAM